MPVPGSEGALSSPDTLDMLKRDRFELLSAYLDSEVTAAERRQVEEWLSTDPAVQRLYARLLKLRQGFRMMPTPAPTQSVEQTMEQVFDRVDRRPKLTVLLGGAGAAIAALFLGVVSTVLPGEQSPEPQVAQQPSKPAVAPEVMMIALDRPVVNIPKTPVSNPSLNKKVDSPTSNQETVR